MPARPTTRRPAICRAPYLAGAFLAAACVLGCGDAPADDVPDSAPPATAPADPAATLAPRPAGGCDMISEAEASEAAGVPMHVTSPPGSTGCALDSVPPGLTVEFIRLNRTAVFESLGTFAAAEPLDGIGEAAYFVPVEGQTLAQLHIASGDHVIVATLHAGTAGPDLREIALRFGRVLAPRM